MFVPLAVLIGPFWAGVLSGGGLLGVMHVLMVPAVVIAMLHRRDGTPTAIVVTRRRLRLGQPARGGRHV